MRSRTALIGAVLAVAVAWPALADDSSEVVSVANKYNDDFNKGDVKSANALCTTPSTVIDGFPPHVWSGASGCADWANDLATFSKKASITGTKIVLQKPLHVLVSGDRGYAVFPARISYISAGKPISGNGVWTFGLQKIGAGWRISAWSWAQQ